MAVTFTAAGQSATIVPQGSSVKVKLLQFISSETSQPGEVVHFEVFEDVVAGDRVVISRRTPVLGSITNAKAYRSFSWHWPWWTRSPAGRLMFTITQTRSVDGRVVQLSGPVLPGNETSIHSRIRWYHEGEVFDAIVANGT